MKKENKWVHQNMIGVYPPLSNRDCRGCDPMVVGFTTTCSISAYHH